MRGGLRRAADQATSASSRAPPSIARASRARWRRSLASRRRPVRPRTRAVGDAEVVVTITKSAEPVCGASLKPGVHVNAAGANSADRRELDAETVLRADLRSTDQVAQAQVEAGEYRELVAAGKMKWSDIVELGDLVTEKAAGPKSPADITLFKSLGIALEDVAFGELIYRRAMEQRVGKGDVGFPIVIAGLDPAIHGAVRPHGCAGHRRAKRRRSSNGYARA